MLQCQTWLICTCPGAAAVTRLSKSALFLPLSIRILRMADRAFLRSWIRPRDLGQISIPFPPEIVMKTIPHVLIKWFVLIPSSFNANEDHMGASTYFHSLSSLLTPVRLFVDTNAAFLRCSSWTQIHLFMGLQDGCDYTCTIMQAVTASFHIHSLEWDVPSDYSAACLPQCYRFFPFPILGFWPAVDAGRQSLYIWRMSDPL